ncbi:MAG: carbohydrate ABC transporter permease [Clostridia bacterium]
MKLSKIFISALFLIIGILCLVPFLYIGTMSLSIDAYYEIFLSDFKYLSRFWLSLFLCSSVVFVQIIVSCLAGFAFAKCKFKGKNALYFALIIIMVMPLQVTLVPNYTMFLQLGLLDTYWSLILPSMFLPLGAFILTQAFKAVPTEIMEAAMLDGANVFVVIFRIFASMNKSAVVCVSLLIFMDCWNMVEQPVAYLKDYSKYPLSVILVYLPPETLTAHLVCCVLAVLPVLYLFLYFNKELIEGISLGQVK